MTEAESVEMLEKHGIKATANRVIILRALARQDNPVTLSELENLILTIDKSGVFRTLNLFREQRLVHVIEDGGNGVRYELCQGSHAGGQDDDMHIHFYCEQCRKTYCMEEIPVPLVELPEGFMMQSVNYMVKGVCGECARKRGGMR